MGITPTESRARSSRSYAIVAPSGATRPPRGAAGGAGRRGAPARVLRAPCEEFPKLEVGDGDGVLRAAGRRVFHPRHADVEVAALDGLVDVRPLHLHEARGTLPDSARDPRRDVDVEPADLRRIGRIGFDERRAALGITAPDEDARRLPL